jgi:outer membrane murein-binding lipoprotein Lpp
MSRQRWFRILPGAMFCPKFALNRTFPTCALLGFIFFGVATSPAQDSAQPKDSSASVDSLPQAVRELRDEVRELRATIAEMRSDSEAARAEAQALRHEVEELRAQTSVTQAALRIAPGQASSAVGEPPQPAAEIQDSQNATSQPNPQATQNQSAHEASLEEEYQLLSGKIDDQYQTKVESASKYRVRISGIVLTNLFSNQGTVDNIDIPALAFPRPVGDSGGSVGATLRQSQIGFEVFGPRVAGAKTRADLEADFAGGFPDVPNGVDSGLMRLRTATMHMDWDNTSLVVGQDAIFFSPGSPTSFATLAQPALSYAGNLWSWVPQIRLEHRFDLGENSNLLLQGGILDPVSGEVPSTSAYRSAGPGESSREPAYGTRIAWSRTIFGQPLRLGVGGFYERQDYGFARTVNAWAAMSDVEVPLGSRVSISGKFYRGRALGGLYGGIGQSVLFQSSDIANGYTEVIGLNSIGGWTQLKYRPWTKVEINAAFGMDNPYAKDLEYFEYPYTYGGTVWTRNRSGFANIIYRPRSDLLFSAEYRQIETNALTTGLSGAGHLNLAMGVLF